MIRVVALVLAVVAGIVAPARAEPVSPSEFEALTAGRTLYFRDSLGRFGAEQYRADRKVRWMYADGQCTDGYWYPAGNALCFVYDIDPQPQCWRLTREDGNLRARLVETPQSFGLLVERIDDAPLSCAGPDVGV